MRFRKIPPDVERMICHRLPSGKTHITPPLCIRFKGMLQAKICFSRATKLVPAVIPHKVYMPCGVCTTFFFGPAALACLEQSNGGESIVTDNPLTLSSPFLQVSLSDHFKKLASLLCPSCKSQIALPLSPHMPGFNPEMLQHQVHCTRRWNNNSF